MLKVDRISVMNMENAIRGARNPLNSWARMDSSYDEDGNFVLGENDISLAHRLAVAGSDHRKFLRQIFVSVDWWYYSSSNANSPLWSYLLSVEDAEGNSHWCYFRVDYSNYAL